MLSMNIKNKQCFVKVRSNNKIKYLVLTDVDPSKDEYIFKSLDKRLTKIFSYSNLPDLIFIPDRYETRDIVDIEEVKVLKVTYSDSTVEYKEE